MAGSGSGGGGDGVGETVKEWGAGAGKGEERARRPRPGAASRSGRRPAGGRRSGYAERVCRSLWSPEGFFATAHYVLAEHICDRHQRRIRVGWGIWCLSSFLLVLGIAFIAAGSVSEVANYLGITTFMSGFFLGPVLGAALSTWEEWKLEVLLGPDDEDVSRPWHLWLRPLCGTCFLVFAGFTIVPCLLFAAHTYDSANDLARELDNPLLVDASTGISMAPSDVTDHAFVRLDNAAYLSDDEGHMFAYMPHHVKQGGFDVPAVWPGLDINIQQSTRNLAIPGLSSRRFSVYMRAAPIEGVHFAHSGTGASAAAAGQGPLVIGWALQTTVAQNPSDGLAGTRRLPVSDCNKADDAAPHLCCVPAPWLGPRLGSRPWIWGAVKEVRDEFRTATSEAVEASMHVLNGAHRNATYAPHHADFVFMCDATPFDFAATVRLWGYLVGTIPSAIASTVIGLPYPVVPLLAISILVGLAGLCDICGHARCDRQTPEAANCCYVCCGVHPTRTRFRSHSGVSVKAAQFRGLDAPLLPSPDDEDDDSRPASRATRSTSLLSLPESHPRRSVADPEAAADDASPDGEEGGPSRPGPSERPQLPPLVVRDFETLYPYAARH